MIPLLSCEPIIVYDLPEPFRGAKKQFKKNSNNSNSTHSRIFCQFVWVQVRSMTYLSGRMQIYRRYTLGMHFPKYHDQGNQIHALAMQNAAHLCPLSKSNGRTQMSLAVFCKDSKYKNTGHFNLDFNLLLF